MHVELVLPMCAKWRFDVLGAFLLFVEDLVANEVLLKNYSSPMSDHEEDFNDVQTFSKSSSAESLGGASRAENTDQWTAFLGITANIPPLFDRSTSWFKYEELIDDWLDHTQVQAGKRGPALKNRLVGDASVNEGLLDRETLRSEDGVRYFKNTSRLHFKGALSVFFCRSLFIVICARRENIEMVTWIGKFSLLLMRLKDAWMDMSPTSSMSETGRPNQHHADVAQENEE